MSSQFYEGDLHFLVDQLQNANFLVINKIMAGKESYL